MQPMSTKINLNPATFSSYFVIMNVNETIFNILKYGPVMYQNWNRNVATGIEVTINLSISKSAEDKKSHCN